MTTNQPEDPCALQVPVGPDVLKMLELAYRARRPLLLEGHTGVGKSQIVSQFAKNNGLEIVILDLSLLEPPDLIGLPVIENGKTYYAPPAELPQSGRGILMLEELNRAEIPVMQPALQLLSARRLNSYELPEEWICIAAVNPEDGDYQVHRLDPALRSRFLQVSVCAERESWLTWAESANVHPVILRIVRDHVDAFDDVSPRSWTYASDVLHVLTEPELNAPETVKVAMRGYLPTSWAIRVTHALTEWPEAPEWSRESLLSKDGPDILAKIVSQLEKDGRNDAVTMLASQLRRNLLSDLPTDSLTLAFLESLFASLPGDLREQCLETAVQSEASAVLLRGLGHEASDIAGSYSNSVIRDVVLKAREEVSYYRIRLFVFAALNWARNRAKENKPFSEVTIENLETLAEDAGPAGEDLTSWLRAGAYLKE